MVGFDAKNKHNLDKKFICPKCLLLLRDPVQLTECGHRHCRSCIDTQQGTTMICPQCQTETQRTQMLLDRGFEHDMQSLPIDCSFCQWTGVLNNYQEHLNQSHPNPKCEYCDKQFNSVNALNQHKASECQKLPVNCVLKDFGCNHQIIRGEMEEHYLSQRHQDAILKMARQMRTQSADAQMDTNLSRRAATSDSDPVTTQLQELYETSNTSTNGIETLNNDIERLNDRVHQFQVAFQTLASDAMLVKLGLQESTNSLEKPGSNQANINQHPIITNDEINNTQCISDDGTYVWKVTNFQEKMSDAQSERQTSIYSPPFYSSPTGYKMRARLYLHGDGNARHTHMSLFFVLMRSEYDAILQFPFNFKVTFCLYDQTTAQRHIIDSFRPDIRSNSFQRPRSDMNIASGIPKFFPLTMIQQEGNPYVRDDTMFIKIMVNFGDMPKSVLPYALSLNPGLPTHVQQTMIRQEVERRAQQKI